MAIIKTKGISKLGFKLIDRDTLIGQNNKGLNISLRT